jgi:nucleotidyltransferase substrate binding protein (TIGR01987 family)
LEKLQRRIKETDKALTTLREILKQPYSVIVRDAAIQRFEYTFETSWKLLKEYLRECEGVISNSPKSCFREALSAGLINEEQTMTCLEMADDRNLTSHTYIEEVAEQIYGRLKDYRKLMDDILNFIKSKLEGQE